MQIARGQIERHLDLHPELAPRDQLAQRLADDLARDGADERRLLDQRDETHRREQAVLGVAPAQQRLDAAHLPLRRSTLGW